jgi:putative photosynthetic complex assembly protein
VPLLAVGGLVLATLLAVTVVQLTGVGATRVADAPAVSVRQFTFEDRRDGGIDVRRADTGQVVHSVAPETNGFLRGTMRGLARERKRMGVGPERPFDLIGRADGRLTLVDPSTGRRVDLGSFGPDNSAVFAALMHTR